MAGDDELALQDLPLSGFVRIVTNARMATPAPLPKALAFVTRLRTAPRGRWLPAGNPTWEHLDGLAAQDAGLHRKLIPDAHSLRSRWPTAAS